MKLKSKRGSAIIYVMLAATILAGVSQTVLSISRESSIRGARGRKSAEFMAFYNTVKSLVDDPGTCKRILGGQPFDINGNTTRVVNVQLNMDYGGGAGPIYGLSRGFVLGTKKGWSAGSNSFEIGRLGIRKVPYIDPLGIRPDFQSIRTIFLDRGGPSELAGSPYAGGNNRLQTFKANLIIAPTRVGVDPALNDFRNFPNNLDRITIFVNVQDVAGNGIIRTCHGLYTEAALCESNGGAYDPDAPISFGPSNMNVRCNPSSVCFTAVLSSVPVNRGVTDDQTECVLPFLPSLIGTPGPVPGAGFPNPNRYICQWCNDRRCNWCP